MILNGQEGKNYEININNSEEAENWKDNAQTQQKLFNLINQIIIGTFTSYGEEKREFSLVNTKYFNFKQYFTYNQNIGYLCGFHSLFNIYYFLQYLASKEETQKNKALFNLKNAWSFWSFYKESLNFLLSNLKLEESSINSLKNEGPLERYQFVYLLEEFPKMKKLFNELKINYDISFTKFLYGFGIFNGTFEESIDFQRKIYDFLFNQAEKEKILIILLGIVNHWNILILYRNAQNEISIYLLDSRNSPELFNSIDLYDDINNNKENEIKIENMKEIYMKNILAKKLKNKNITQWYITCWKDWYDSMNKSIIIIFKILSKKLNLINYIIDNKINHLINSFISKTNVDLINFELDNKFHHDLDKNKDKILKWIKEDYHPAVFNDELLHDVKKANFVITEKKFIFWNKFMKAYLNKQKDNNELDENDKNIVMRYLNYINEVEKYFCIIKSI